MSDRLGLGERRHLASLDRYTALAELTSLVALSTYDQKPEAARNGTWDRP